MPQPSKRTPSADKRPVGRRSTFNAKDAAEIVARLSKGEPLTHICADDWLPCDDTVRNWADANPDFARDIARAREAGFDQIALDALRIADGKSSPEERAQAEEAFATTGAAPPLADPQRDRLRVETRLKLLAKWDPKRYGDKLAHVGGDDDAPIKAELTLRFV